MIRRALTSAGLSPADIDAVEAHGTGTALGDPIEAQALLASYGQDRPEDRPLWLGSVKSNIGHAQAAAGVAGVIKMVQAMRHGVLPRTLHVDEPSSHVDWSAGAVSLLREERPWERNGEPRRAGVSSFGISGTNAHVILEEAPAIDPVDPVEDGAFAGGVVPLVLSGRSVAALRAQAGRLREFVAGDPGLGMADVGCSLAVRSVFGHRAVVLGDGRGELLRGLSALERGEPGVGMVEGSAPAGGGLVFLFTGQGSQRVGMGRELYGSFGAFRDALDGVCAGFDAHLECSLLEVLFASEGSPEAGLLDRTLFTQTGLFAVEVALFRLLEGWGVRPDFLLGHSIGEISAAHVAGVFSLEDACRLVAARGRLMGELPEGGAMVSIQASERDVSETLEGYEGRVALAAVNGPSAVVVSGDGEAVLDLAGVWGERGAKTKRLRVSHAFHSPRMDAMLERFADVARGVSFSAPLIPIVSNLTGELLSDEQACSPEYWVRHVREPVRFMEGVRWLGAQEAKNFLELGPDGILSAMAQECLVSGPDVQNDAGGANPVMAPVLRGGRSEVEALLGALAEVWTHGVNVDWSEFFASSRARRIGLPTYAFQRERYWLSPEAETGDVASIGLVSAEHPLLGAAVGLAGDRGLLFTGRLSLASHAWLSDHVVMGTVLLPGTAFLEFALHAGSQVGCAHVSELTLETPLVLPGDGAVVLQVAVGDLDEAGGRTVGIYSRPEDVTGDGGFSEEEWTCHASGVLVPQGRADSPDARRASVQGGVVAPLPRSPGLLRAPRLVAVDDLYDRLAERGFEYGPVFQGLRAAWRDGDVVYAEVALADGQQEAATAFGIHPALLDAALHAAVLDLLAPTPPWSGTPGYASRSPGLASSFTRAARPGCGYAFPVGGDGISLAMADETGALVATVDALIAREIAPDQLGAIHGAHRDRCSRCAGARSSPPRGPVVDDIVLLGAGDTPLARSLAGAGHAIEAHADLRSLAAIVEEGDPAPGIVLVDCGAIGTGSATETASAEGVSGSDGPGGGPVPLHRTAHRVLALLQDWVSDERFSGSRLALITTAAVPARAGERVPGLSQSRDMGTGTLGSSGEPRTARADRYRRRRSLQRRAVRGAGLGRAATRPTPGQGLRPTTRAVCEGGPRRRGCVRVWRKSTRCLWDGPDNRRHGHAGRFAGSPSGDGAWRGSTPADQPAGRGWGGRRRAPGRARIPGGQRQDRGVRCERPSGARGVA